MIYSNDNIAEISEKYEQIPFIYNEFLQQIFTLDKRLTNEIASEYLKHGVGRRIRLITRCLTRIFTIFPVDRIECLQEDDLADVNIYLHAFIANISGILDNLGWVFVYEHNLYGDKKDAKLCKYDVGLFNIKTQVHLHTELREYLKSDAIKFWYKNYTKIYRDSLAHRIPLYVPPSLLDDSQFKKYENINNLVQGLNASDDSEKYSELLNKQDALGNACLFFTQSLNEGEPVYLHPQIISDYLTIEKIVKLFITNIK